MSNHQIKIATLKQSLLRDLSKIYDGNEAYAVTRLILEHFNFPESSILRDPHTIVDKQTRAEIKKIVNDLYRNIPVQYAIGKTIFYDLVFEVNDKVLIPRPETEELVSNILLENNLSAPHILDIGTGSGCIAVSLKAMLPASSVLAMEVDKGALAVARRNATLNKVDIQFLDSSLFDYLPSQEDASFDIIVSNPPYVKRSEMELMHPRVTKNEPDLALFVPDEDPLIFYREISRLAQTSLKEKGFIWLEINEAHGEELVGLLLNDGFRNVRKLKDIHGKDRFIKAGRYE